MSDPETLGWACQTCGRDSMFCACNPETSTDPPAAPTGTGAGVAALVERLREISQRLSLHLGADYPDAVTCEEAAAALTQQATQLQEAQKESNALAYDKTCLHEELASLRAELVAAQQARRALDEATDT